MELTISKKSFIRILSRTHAVADRKSSMPILSNVLVTAEKNGRIRLSATDLYLGVSSFSDANVKKPGNVAVSARTIYEIVKNLPEGEVRVAVDEKHAAEIRAGKVRYRIPGMPGDDFPPLPNPDDHPFVEIETSVIGELIAMTQYSMSTDETRPHLAGALLEGEGTAVRMVTTDGHRLSKAQMTTGSSKKLNLSMLVPNRGVSELRRIIEDAKADEEKAGTIGVASVGGNAFFRRESVQLSVKLADDQFPPYAKVIPMSHKRRVGVRRQKLVEALRRIALVASDKSGGIRIKLSAGTMQLTSENPDVGEGSEEIEVDYAGEGLVIGFNAKYLLDVLGALIEEEVFLEFSGELDPGVIRASAEKKEFVGVIMPMRI